MFSWWRLFPTFFNLNDISLWYSFINLSITLIQHTHFLKHIFISIKHFRLFLIITYLSPDNILKHDFQRTAHIHFSPNVITHSLNAITHSLNVTARLEASKRRRRRRTKLRNLRKESMKKKRDQMRNDLMKYITFENNLPFYLFLFFRFFFFFFLFVFFFFNHSFSHTHTKQT